MRKLSILLIGVLLAAVFCLTACDSSGSSQSTESGVMVEMKDSSGKVTGYERHSYDENGSQTRLDVFDAEQTCLYYILYTYDDSKRLLTETRYSGEGFAEHRYVYTYDDADHLIEMAYELPHGEAEVTRYDTNGDEIERLYYDTDEKLVKREVLENGKWKTYTGEEAGINETTGE